MRNSLLSFALIAGLFLPMGVIYAQDTSTVTATCKDGTAFTGTKRSGACRGHGGVQSWGATSTATSPVATPPPPAAATSQRSATSPGAGAGQVWVNTASKVYHCPATVGMARPNTAVTCRRRRPKRKVSDRTTGKLAAPKHPTLEIVGE